MCSHRIPDRAAAAFAVALLATAASAQPRTPIDFEAVLECRARAIAQLRLADFETAAFGEPETRALREMADFAIRLGVWGRSPRSVARAVEDMALGEAFLIENARRVSRIAREWESGARLDSALAACVATVWTAARAVVDDLLVPDDPPPPPGGPAPVPRP